MGVAGDPTVCGIRAGRWRGTVARFPTAAAPPLAHRQRHVQVAGLRDKRYEGGWRNTTHGLTKVGIAEIGAAEVGLGVGRTPRGKAAALARGIG